MANPVWQNLQKSQDDSETIEQAIARIVASHNDNANSHLDEGQSLQSHRASETIDHLVKSIVEAILADGAVSSRAITSDQIIGKDIRTAKNVGATVDGVKFNSDGIQMYQDGQKKVDIPVNGNPFFAGYIYASGLFYLKSFKITSWESLDGWNTSGTGSATNGWGVLNLETTTTINSHISLDNEGIGIRAIDFDNNSPYFQVFMKFWQNTSQLAYFTMGQNPLYGDACGFGFKVSNGSLYAVYYDIDHNETAVEITGVDITGYHIYRAEMVSGESLKFFVDNELKHSADYDSDTFPSDDTPVQFSFALKTLTSAKRYISCENLLLSQDF